MRQMVYTSVATSQMDQADVFTIVQTSVSNNMARDVTGFLIYGDGRFLQLIEGADGDLRGLMTTLKGDPRHRDITVLIDEPVTERKFSRWRMQRVTRDGEAMGEIRRTLAGATSGRAALREIDRFLAH